MGENILLYWSVGQVVHPRPYRKISSCAKTHGGQIDWKQYWFQELWTSNVPAGPQLVISQEWSKAFSLATSDILWTCRRVYAHIPLNTQNLLFFCNPALLLLLGVQNFFWHFFSQYPWVCFDMLRFSTKRQRVDFLLKRAAIYPKHDSKLVASVGYDLFNRPCMHQSQAAVIRCIVIMCQDNHVQLKPLSK